MAYQLTGFRCRGVRSRLLSAFLASVVSLLQAGCGGSGDDAASSAPNGASVQSRALSAGTGTGGVRRASELTTGIESIYSEAGKLIRGDESLVALGNEMFGDRVSLYNGALEFVQTDVSVPGGSSIPMAVGRRHIAPVSLNGGRGGYTGGHFGDWDLEIPHLHGVFSSPGWTVGGIRGAGADQRCTYFGAPPAANGTLSSTFNPDEYWHGSFLYVPGSGSQEILRRVSGPTPANDPSYRLTTKDRWAITCVAALRNGTGEGFLAIGPDGTRYRFDWMVKRPYAAVTKASPNAVPRPVAVTNSDTVLPEIDPNAAVGGPVLQRVEYWILPTEIIDRYGNKLTYNYSATNAWRLESIVATEGADSAANPRKLTFTYDPSTSEGYQIRTVSDGARTWPYAYRATAGGNVLSTLTLPDTTSQWTFNLDALTYGSDLIFNPSPNCLDPNDLYTEPHTGTMTHPSGAVGSFTVKGTQHGRSNVERVCRDSDGNGDSGFPVYPRYIDRFSIVGKSISGPGLATMNWAYEYSAANVSFAPCNNCEKTKTVTVTDPRSVATRYTFGTEFRVTEGQLLKTEEGFDRNSSTALRTTVRAYHSPTAGPYPDPIGDSTQKRGNGELAARHTPEDYKAVTQQEVTFTWSASDFDQFAKPVNVVRSSTLGYSRAERTAYHHHWPTWVLSQLLTVSHIVNGAPTLEISGNSYDAITGNRTESRSFGLVKQSFAYYGDGTLRTKSDRAGKTTTFSNYKRGLARSVVYADQQGESAAIDDTGLIESVTNAVGKTTSYAYDTAGRLRTIQHPAETTFVYNNTEQSFAQRNVHEFGLAPGHWLQTITVGNSQTERYFDAMWQPVLTRVWDVSDPANTTKVTLRRFDSDHRPTFESYPLRAINSVADTVPGITRSYDALGRALAVAQDSELGPLVTSTEYLSGFRKQVTKPRGADTVTVTSYQAFDTPSEDAIVGIAAPLGTFVSIVRDPFDKPLSVTRYGYFLSSSATRSYVYDGNQRLCKTVEPESRATVPSYDESDNVQWRASGLNLLSTTSCDQAGAPENRKVTFSYDPRNRLLNTTPAGGYDIRRTYTPDGLLQDIKSESGTWTYRYNNRRMLFREELDFAGLIYVIERGINANGHVAWMQMPRVQTVLYYAPNALGEPTQVADSSTAYASNVIHHPNGALASYTLANGTLHSMEQNARLLPKTLRDVGYATGQAVDVVRQQMSYDRNGNVESIDDLASSSNSRGMGYDALDRLTTVDGYWHSAGNILSTASYTYDALDNIKTSKVGLRNFQHEIDSTTNRLTGLTSLNGNYASVTPIQYDDNGNVSQRGANQGYTFDLMNRMRQAAGKANYGYDGHGRRWWTGYLDAPGTFSVYAYSRDGKLMYSTHNTKGEMLPIYLGDQLIAERHVGGSEGDSLNYVHTDALGSPVARTATNGQVLSRERYESYGAAAPNGAAQSNGIGFTGHVSDAYTGLVYMQQRYYDPIAGRFLSVDPVATDASSGSHFNRYVYANNNPYKFKDPDGNSPAHVAAFAIGFGVDLVAQGLSGKSASEVFSRDGLTSDAIAGVGAAITGGIGGALAGAALRETISVGAAVAGTAAAGGAVGAATTVATELATKGQMPTGSQIAVGAGSAALGSAAGAAIGNTGVALTQKMAATGGVMGHVATQTRSAVQSTQSVTVGVGAARAIATASTDLSSAAIGKVTENQLPQK